MMTFDEKAGKLQLAKTLLEWKKRLEKKHECAIICDRDSKAEHFLALLEKCEKSLKEVRALVEPAIYELEEREPLMGQVLELKYLYGLSAEDISDVLVMSERWIYALQKDGIEALNL